MRFFAIFAMAAAVAALKMNQEPAIVLDDGDNEMVELEDDDSLAELETERSRIDWCDANLTQNLMSAVDRNNDGKLQYSEIRSALRGAGLSRRKVRRISLFLHARFAYSDCYLSKRQAERFIKGMCRRQKYGRSSRRYRGYRGRRRHFNRYRRSYNSTRRHYRHRHHRNGTNTTSVNSTSV